MHLQAVAQLAEQQYCLSLSSTPEGKLTLISCYICMHFTISRRVACIVPERVTLSQERVGKERQVSPHHLLHLALS